MKQILLFIAMTLFAVNTVYSTNDNQPNFADDVSYEHGSSDSLYQKALKAIDGRKFVIKANTLTLKQGRSGNVDSESNFVVLNDEKATIQVHLYKQGGSDAAPVLQEGKVSNLNKRYSKKGDVLLDAKVQNGSFIIKINIRLKKGTNIAHVRVSSIGNNEDFTLVGTLIPGDITEVNAVPVIGVRRL